MKTGVNERNESLHPHQRYKLLVSQLPPLEINPRQVLSQTVRIVRRLFLFTRSSEQRPSCFGKRPGVAAHSNDAGQLMPVKQIQRAEFFPPNQTLEQVFAFGILLCAPP